MDKFINPTKPAEIEIEKDEPVVVSRGQNIDQTFYGIGEDLPLNFFLTQPGIKPDVISMYANRSSPPTLLSFKARFHSQK